MNRIKNGRALVNCDDDLCQAFADPSPDSLEELKAALEHWESHSVLCGCSHGC